MEFKVGDWVSIKAPKEVHILQYRSNKYYKVTKVDVNEDAIYLKIDDHGTYNGWPFEPQRFDKVDMSKISKLERLLFFE